MVRLNDAPGRRIPISLLLTLTPASAEVMRELLPKLDPSYAASTLYLIQLLFAGSGVAMVLSGILLQLRGSNLKSSSELTAGWT